MVVDDEPVNLRLLVGMLRERGYRVSAFPRGRLALAAAEQEPPDLILLDIVMPEMTGYDVCERLKANPKLKDIPVMFMSALDEMMDKVRAFELGGVDYIAKPYQLPEVETRVQTQVRLLTLQRELARHHAELDELVSQRTRQLVEAQGRRVVLEQAQSALLEVLARELPMPLEELFGLVDQVFVECSWSKAVRESQDRYDSCRQRIRTLCDEAAWLTQIDAEAAEAAAPSSPLDAALYAALDQVGALAQARNVGIDFAPTGLGLVQGKTELLAKALHALVATAVKLSNSGGTVRVIPAATSQEIRLLIEAHGRTIPAEALPRFFDIRAVGEGLFTGAQLGLAPAVAERIIALLGGAVTVENLEPPGVRLCVVLQSVNQANLLARPERRGGRD